MSLTLRSRGSGVIGELPQLVRLRSLVQPGGELRSVSRSKLEEDIRDVALHGLPRQEQAGCDLRVCGAAGDQASPHISDATAPTLLVHGTLDRMVPHQQSVAYHLALDDAGVPNKLELVEGADHCFFGGDVDAIVDTTVAFLRDELTATEEDR